MDKIAVIYHPDKNPAGESVDGAPRRDMPVSEWQELPDQVRRSVAAAGYYEVTPAGGRAAETTNQNDLTAALPGVPADTVKALVVAGYDTADKVVAAADEELLAIPGIKRGRLEQIRWSMQTPAGPEQEGE